MSALVVGHWTTRDRPQVFIYVMLIIPFSRVGCAETVAPSVGALPHAEFCTPFRNTRQREQRLLT
jgi:hypothetical protein